MSHPEQPEQYHPARGDRTHPDYEQWLADAKYEADPPFGGHLITHSDGRNRDATFYELENRPDLFIRQVPENLSTTELKQHMGQFDLMRQSGINVPEYSAVISHSGQTGYSRRRAVHYLVAQKVTGTELRYLNAQQASSETRLQAAIIRLSRGLAKYIQTCADTNEPLAEDICTKQFIYGTTANNPEPDLYMIDLDPLYAESAKHPRMQEWAIFNIQDTMADLELLCPIDEEIGDSFRTAIEDFCEKNLTADEQKYVITWHENGRRQNQEDTAA